MTGETPWLGRTARSGDPANAPRLLLLCDYRPHEAATVLDHIDAIRRWSRYAVYVLPMHGDIPDTLDLEAFDGLLIHYNLIMAEGLYLSPLARWRISQYTGIKGAFIQDEYRFVDDSVSVMGTLGINVLFSCVPSDQVEKVYPAERLPQLRSVINVLTGYVPEGLLAAPTVPYEARAIEVGYRGRRLPAWLGELAQEKVTIAERFLADAPAYGLAVDISCDESDRLYGPAWTDFISRCRAMLGVESGASVFDFDGSIERSVRQHLAVHPDTSFVELQRRFFADAEGRIRLNQISPRCFEAAALGTLMILYPGEYSGILQPWRHYVPLEKDHGNMAAVVHAIRDPATWSEITQRAREEVALNPAFSYRAMAEAVDRGLDLHEGNRKGIPRSSFVRLAAQSYARMRETKLHALGLPPAVNRIRLRIERVAQLLTPNATAIAPSARHAVERQHALRGWIRIALAAAYWIVRPHLVPWPVLLRGGRQLLVDLGELGRLQRIGGRAERLMLASPYVLLLDDAAHELRVVGRGQVPPSVAVGSLPRDLAGATAIRFDLEDRWLTPIDIPERRTMHLPAVSALLRSRPPVARRLIIGGVPWCGLARQNASR
jgi:hypothetical protein